MVDSVSSGAALQIPPGKGINLSTNNKDSKVKIDLESVPENKMKLRPLGTTGTGQGLKIDIKV